MVITIGSTKGGVGKSTLGLHLSYVYALRGMRVCLIDGDAQGSVYKWVQVRSQIGLSSFGFSVRYLQGDSLLSFVQKGGVEYDMILIDSAGSDDATSRSAFVCADVILTPCGASALELWELSGLVSLVAELEKARGKEVPLYLFFSRVPSAGRARVLSEARAYLSGIGWAMERTLGAVIGERASYRWAAGSGQTIFDYRPSDKKAQAEMLALADELLLKTQNKIS